MAPSDVVVDAAVVLLNEVVAAGVVLFSVIVDAGAVPPNVVVDAGEVPGIPEEQAVVEMINTKKDK